MKKKNNDWIYYLLVLLLIGGLGYMIYVKETGNYVTNNYYTTNNQQPTPTQTPTETPQEEGGLFDWIENIFIPQTSIPILPDVTCTDSDGQGAINPMYVPGYVLQGGTGTNDICTGNGQIMKEYSCSGVKIIETTVDCADYGKVCVTEDGRGYCETPFCGERDFGDKPYDGGDCEDNFGMYYDSCTTNRLGQGTLKEYYCRAGRCTYKTYDCACATNGVQACQMLVT